MQYKTTADEAIPPAAAAAIDNCYNLGKNFESVSFPGCVFQKNTHTHTTVDGHEWKDLQALSSWQ